MALLRREKVKITTPETDQDFEKYFQLRWKILRKPWNQPEGSERDEDEDSSYHIMAKDGNHVTGVARLQNIAPGQAQIRYMAVDNDHQGKGIGRLLMEHIENYARDHNIHEIILHARENAVPFYEKLGYELIEKSHLLFNIIQHYKMSKRL